MNISGRVQNGVVIPDGNTALPEGALVCISIVAEAPRDADKHRVQLPLVASEQPGTLKLTNHNIAELMDAEDGAPRH